jgi:hypothetical protein
MNHSLSVRCTLSFPVHLLGLFVAAGLTPPSASQDRCERVGQFIGTSGAVHTAFFGSVRVDEASGPNGPVPFRLADCDNDGQPDLAIDWSLAGAAPFATVDFGAACGANGPLPRRVTLRLLAGDVVLRAFDASGSLLANAAGGPLFGVQDLELEGAGIARVEVEGGQMCLVAVCWSCGEGPALLTPPVPAVREFTRADANGDGAVDISDPVSVLGALFLGDEEPDCFDAADANDSGALDLSDAVYTLQFLFLGGPPPRPPFPQLGIDPTVDALDCGPHYFVAQLDPAAMISRALAGGPVQIDLGGQEVEVKLVLEDIFDYGCELFANFPGVCRSVPADFVFPFSGEVIGAEGSSHVRLTLTRSALTGYVELGDEVWVIEPLRDYVAGAAAGEYLVYRAGDIEGVLDYGEDFIRVSLAGGGAGAGDGGGAGDILPHDPLFVRVAMVADLEYIDLFNRIGLMDWRAQQVAVINAVNGIYRTANTTLRIRGHFQFDTIDLFFRGRNTCELLSELDEFWSSTFDDLRSLARRRGMRIDLAHLTSGKFLEGITIGQGFEPGVYSVSQHNFSSGEVCFRGRGGGRDGHVSCGPNYDVTLIVAHEIGHNLNAAHESADRVCVRRGPSRCHNHRHTVMWGTIQRDMFHAFSQGFVDRDHNNAARIRQHILIEREVDFAPFEGTCE